MREELLKSLSVSPPGHLRRWCSEMKEVKQTWINSNTDMIVQALAFSKDFKNSDTERHKLLERHIDDAFRWLLLHAKKKDTA